MDAFEGVVEHAVIGNLLARPQGRLDPISLARELGICHGFRDGLLKRIDRAGAIPELRLFSPEHVVRQPAVERLAQQTLLDLAVVRQLPLGGDRERRLDHRPREERHPRHEAMPGGRAVDPLQPAVVPLLQPIDQRALQRVGIVELGQILIATEDLIGALATKHDVDVPRGHLGDDVVGDRAADQRGVEVLQAPDDAGQSCQRLVVGVGQLDMLGAEMRGHLTRCLKIGRALGADGEGLEDLAAITIHPAGDGADEARIETAGEERADFAIAMHLRLDAPDQRLANAVPRPCRRRALRRRSAHKLRRYRVGEALEAALGRPHMTRREVRDVGKPIVVERAQL